MTTHARLTPLQMCKGVLLILKHEPKFKAATLAATLGISEAYAINLIRVASMLTPVGFKAWDERKMAFADVLRIVVRTRTRKEQEKEFKLILVQAVRVKNAKLQYPPQNYKRTKDGGYKA